MTLSEYLPILLQIILALAIAGIILLASHIFGQRSRGNKVKNTAYECGLPAGDVHPPRFAVKFYLTAMLFIIFDIEVIFLIPWVTVFREFIDAGIPILLPGLFFLFVLILGLVYELKKGALEWEK